MRRRRRRRRRRRFLQEVAHRTRRGCARRRGLVLASASCCSFGRRGHRAWWRGGACWLPLMPFAVFGYFHGGCWRARAQLRQYPPQTCSASIDALSLTPHVSHKKKTRPRATLSRPGPRDSSRYGCGLRGARAGARRPPAVGRHLTRRRDVQELSLDTPAPGEAGGRPRFWRGLLACLRMSLAA